MRSRAAPAGNSDTGEPFRHGCATVSTLGCGAALFLRFPDTSMPFIARTSLFRTGLLAAAVCATAASACGDPSHWGYDNLASPSQWAGIAPACAGPQQSPIDL